MHIHPIAFAIPAAALGIALGYGLIQLARRGDNPKRRIRIVLYALLLVMTAWLTVDFFLIPAHRWVDAVCLALAGLVLAVGYGVEWFRRSKAHPER